MINRLLIWTLILTSALCGQKVWHESSFEDFIDGSFDDGGANMYVSFNGRIQPINRWDVNNDGNVDILCVNSHPLVEMLDMSIYWGNGKDFSIKNHTYIPANGPMWATADDLNNDGETDLVVANYSNGTWTEMESFVYYGGLDKNYEPKDGEWAHYPFKKRVLLPGSNTQKAATGDFNNDGYKDIVFAFSGGFWEYRDKSSEGSSFSRIYWGSKDDFNPENFTNIKTAGATDVVSADFNGDNLLDLAFANGEGNTSYIYLGTKNGFSDLQLIELPTLKAHAVETGDINNDGLIDVLFACESGTESYAYLNENGRFSADNRIVFETYAAKDIVIADFNKDNRNDVFFSNHQFSFTGDPNLANRLIYSYIYFGSDTGFSKSNRQSIPTIGAWGANAADLNNDGWTDLVISNFQEHYSYEVPSFIYWNSPDGFSETVRTPLYEHGAQGNTIADLNNDGFLDILVTSMMGRSRGDYDNSYLYFGKDNGRFDIDNRVELPGRDAYEQAFADLDDDGEVDILLVNRGEITRLVNEVWIYWNNKNEFDPWNMSGLVSNSGLGAQVADLDKNGYLDIIISNGSPNKMSGREPEGSFVYWGDSLGWAVTERTLIPMNLTRACTVCDINYDGHLDLVFGNQEPNGLATIFYGDGTRNYSLASSIKLPESKGTGNPGVADFNKDGLLDIAFAHNSSVKVFYQKNDYQFTGPQSIPVQAKTMTVGDVNNDGWLDLVCPYYKGEGRRTWYSTVLLGSENGFDIENSLKFKTDGGTGALVCDFNRDNFNDVLFYCHRKDGSFDEIKNYGDHSVNSLIYYGSREGFSDDNIEKLPSVGVHYDMGVDIGNISNRKSEYSYISSPYFTDGQNPAYLKWSDESTPHSKIKFQLRIADSKEKLNNAGWQGPEGENSYYTITHSGISGLEGKWIQYKAVFESENGGGVSALEMVEIGFEK